MDSLSLLDLPGNVMHNIMRNFNFRHLMSLRKVCRTFRAFFDDVKPEANFSQINIHLEDDHIIFHYQFYGEPENVMRYYMEDYGCLVQHGKDTRIEGVTANEVFYQDFKSILCFQKKTLDRFLVYGRDVAHDEIYNEFVTKIGIILENSGNILKVQNFFIDAQKQNQIMQFLRFFEQNVLKKIHFQRNDDDEVLEMNQIVELEQWKNCETAILGNMMINPGIEHFLHLTKAVLIFQEVSVEDLIKVKEVMTNTNSIKTFHIGYENYGVESEFENLVGDPVTSDSGEQKDWYFRLPDTTEKVLHIFNDTEYDIHFKFERIPTANIKEGALVYE